MTDTHFTKSGALPPMCTDAKDSGTVALAPPTLSAPPTIEQLLRHFDRFNQQYFGGRIPKYRIVLDRFVGGRCERERKTIFLASSDPEILGVLLHEMAHAITSGSHGKLFQSEIRRLNAAGAPIPVIDLTAFGPEGVNEIETRSMIFDQFESAGLESEQPWHIVRRLVGWEYGLVDNQGRVADTTAARLLKHAQRIFVSARKIRARHQLQNQEGA